MSGNAPTSGYIVHPSGARVDFTVRVDLLPTGGGGGLSSYPFGLVEKTISGPGLGDRDLALRARLRIRKSRGRLQGRCLPDANLYRRSKSGRIDIATAVRPRWKAAAAVARFDDGQQFQSDHSPAAFAADDVNIADNYSPSYGYGAVLLSGIRHVRTRPVRRKLEPDAGSFSSNASEYLTPEVKRVEHLQGRNLHAPSQR